MCEETGTGEPGREGHGVVRTMGARAEDPSATAGTTVDVVEEKSCPMWSRGALVATLLTADCLRGGRLPCGRPVDMILYKPYH